MSRKKIVIIGGGSNAWTPNIIKDMLLTPAIQDSEFVLYDINTQASDLNVTFLQKLNARFKTKATFTSTDQRKTAFKNADYFIITISTGGFDAMAHDLAIPEKFGVYHTVGDTSGPGGWSRLLRNFDVFVDLANDINKYASGAVILNYTNPMTTLTDVLARICTGPVVGLCHGLFENLRFLTKYYKLNSEDDLAVQYAGLNHFFWITSIKAGGKDLLADLRQRMKTKGFTQLLHDATPDSMGFKSNRELATELFHLTGGIMPYLGDRHTSEFFPCYVTSKKNLKKYKLLRTTIKQRKAGFAERAKALHDMIAGDIPVHYLKRSRETAADIINAHSQGKTFIDVGNVPNIGQISNLPLGTVVETAVRVDANGFSPIAFGPLPEKVLGLVSPYADVFKLTVDACFRRDKALALHALRIDPVCSHLNADQVRDMGEQLIAAHKQFITVF
jgi:alpha-galactosidase/6-phospho-beta-glucosidase family protein